MPDESTPPAGQVPASGQAPQGTQQTPSGQAPTGETFDADRAQALIAKLREEAKAATKELTAFRTAKQQADDATLSETARLAKERDTLKAQIEADRQDRQAQINHYEVKLKAAALGIVDPDAAALLLDWDSVEYAEDGSPKNIEAALKALLKAKPYLAAQPGQSSGAPMNPATGRGGSTLTLDDIKKMTPAQTVARWPEVSKVLAGG